MWYSEVNGGKGVGEIKYEGEGSQLYDFCIYSRMYELVCNSIDGVCLSADLLPGLLVSRSVQRVENYLLQVGVYCSTVYTHHLIWSIDFQTLSS